MIVELHMIQNFAPSNLNRDDTNAPKDAEFGGYRRARISSQAIKRAIRRQFQLGLVAEADQAKRTKRLLAALTSQLVGFGRPESESQTVAAAALGAVRAAVGPDGKTQYLLFLGGREINRLAAVCQEHWEELVTVGQAAPAGEGSTRSGRTRKKEGEGAVPDEVRKALLACFDGGQAVDLALFGRMIADLPEHNVDAASQVAHAISTHQVSMEFDFYTAVDDLKKDDTAGADMMGTVQFNSACFYRYANLDVDQLTANLGGDASRAASAVEAFLKAAVEAIPTGKQNSMAAQNPPSLVFAVVRDRGFWSLANAFVKPVRPGSQGDLVESSVVALDDYWGRLEQVYGTRGLRLKAVATLEDATSLKNLAPSRLGSVDELVAQVVEVMSSRAAGAAVGA